MIFSIGAYETDSCSNELPERLNTVTIAGLDDQQPELPELDCETGGKRARREVLFNGVPLHPLTMAETLAEVESAVKSRRPLQHVALNVAKFVKMRRDQDLRNDVLGADIVGVDGMGIVIGARLLGVKIPERVAGVDLMDNVLELCAARGFRPYLLGARPDVLCLAKKNLKHRFPTLRIAGCHHGYFGDGEEAAVVRDIQMSAPDCLFVGMPTPRKERFMATHFASLRVPFVMGVGGGLDILAGHVKRAPGKWQRHGFEWLFRVLQEPRRMWWRYMSTNILYASVLARALVSRALHSQRV